MIRHRFGRTLTSILVAVSGLGLAAIPTGPAWAAVVPGWELRQISDTQRQIFAADATSSTDVWGVGTTRGGGSQRAVRFDGSAWSPVALPNSPTSTSLSGIDMLTTTDGWVVGREGQAGLIERWDGSTFTKQTLPALASGEAQELADVSALGPNSAFASGRTAADGTSVGALLKWNGTTWAAFDTTGVGVTELATVQAVAPGDVWVGGAVGSGATAVPLLAHWDGAAWTVATLPDVGVGIVRELTSFAGDDVWAVGTKTGVGDDHPKSLVLHWDGMAWTMESVPYVGTHQNDLQTIGGTSSDDLWAVGGFNLGLGHWSTLALHRDAAGWSASPTANPKWFSPAPLYGIAATTSTDVWAFGIIRTEALHFGAALPHVAEITLKAGSPYVGQPVELTGSLSFSRGAYAGGQTVQLTRRAADGTFKDVGSAITNDDGSFDRNDTPHTRGRYTYTATLVVVAPWSPAKASVITDVNGLKGSLSLSADPAHPRYGTSVKLSGVLTGHGSNHQVKLFAKPAGADRKLIDRIRVSSNGGFKVEVRPRWNTSYQAEFSGDEKYVPTKSELIGVSVKPIVHTKMVEVDRTSGRYAIYDYDRDCPAAGHRGCPSVKTWFVPPYPGAPYDLTLQVHYQGRWITTTQPSFKLSSNGSQVVHFYYSRDDQSFGLPWRVRSLFFGTKYFAPAKSGWVYFKVIR